MRQKVDSLLAATNGLVAAHARPPPAAAAEHHARERPSGKEPFDRDINTTLVKINAKEDVTISAIKVVVKAWAEELGLLPETYEVTSSGNLSKRFVIECTGPADMATRRANKLMASLRAEDGSWVRKTALSPANRVVELFIGPDKNRRQILTEIFGRKLFNAFKEQDVESKALGSPERNFKYLRREGIVSEGWVEIAKVEPEADGSCKCLWNERGVIDKKIQKQEIMAIFDKEARHPTQWV